MIHLCLCEFHAPGSDRSHPTPEKEKKNMLEEWKTAHLRHETRSLDASKDKLNPRVIDGLLQAAKWLAECQISYHIESCPVIPSDHILGAALCVFMQAFDEEIHVSLDEGLLLAHRLLR